MCIEVWWDIVLYRWLVLPLCDFRVDQAFLIFVRFDIVQGNGLVALLGQDNVPSPFHWSVAFQRMEIAPFLDACLVLGFFCRCSLKYYRILYTDFADRRIAI